MVMVHSTGICSYPFTGVESEGTVKEMKRWTVGDWTWSGSHRSPDVTLSQNRLAAYFHTSPLLESNSVAGWYQKVLFLCACVFMCAYFSLLPPSLEEFALNMLFAKTRFRWLQEMIGDKDFSLSDHRRDPMFIFQFWTHHLNILIMIQIMYIELQKCTIWSTKFPLTI